MYTHEQIAKGIRNPELVKNEIEAAYTILYDKIVNKVKERNQLEKNSQYGLVLNWGLHRRGDWTVAEYPFFINQFIDRFDPIILTSQKLYDEKYNELENIFAFGARNNKGPTLDYKSNHNLLLFASDPNTKPNWLYNYIEKNNVDKVLSPVYNSFFHWMPQLPDEKLEFFPWAVPEKFVLKPDEVRFRGNDQIHLSGATGSEVYEMRDWCRQKEYVDDFKNSGHQNRVFEHDEYYQWLQNYDCMVAAGSLKKEWQYLFGKYFEIPAAGALLFAQYSNDLEKAGFNDQNCVIFDSKDEFHSKAQEYINDPKGYLKTRKKGVELIRSKHTISNRINQADQLFS